MQAERIWSTRSAAAGAEAAYWRTALHEAVFELETKIPSRDGFHGRIKQQALGPIAISAISLNREQTIWRTRSAIARATSGQFEFVTIRRGSARLDHCGADIVLKTGDSVLIDSRRVYCFSTSRESRTLSYHLPEDWLQNWIDMSDEVIAAPIRSNTVWGTALLAMAEELVTESSQIDPGFYAVYADQLAGALNLALSRSSIAHLSNEKPVFDRARELIRAYAYDRNLDVCRASGILRISPRYLHKVFASQGTTFSAELLSERLKLAIRMLSDPLFQDTPIAEIARRAGFSDPSHFSRRFRGQFGVSPCSYRHSVGAGGHPTRNASAALSKS